MFNAFLLPNNSSQALNENYNIKYLLCLHPIKQNISNDRKAKALSTYTFCVYWMNSKQERSKQRSVRMQKHKLTSGSKALSISKYK